MPTQWNYGYCEGNKEARVLFKNSGSTEWQTVISTAPPVFWETEIIEAATAPFGGKGQCCGKNYMVYYDVSTNSGETWTGGYRNNFTGKILEVVHIPSASNMLAQLKTQECDGIIRYKSLFTGSLSMRVRITNIVRLDGLPDNCAPTENQCKFTVTDSTGVLYTQTTSLCPGVVVECGKKCPPGTCECRNGNTVCCYDSNGIPVLSFTA